MINSVQQHTNKLVALTHIYKKSKKRDNLPFRKFRETAHQLSALDFLILLRLRVLVMIS